MEQDNLMVDLKRKLSSESEYEEALKEAEKLYGAEPYTDEHRKLTALYYLIEQYEEQFYEVHQKVTDLSLN